MSEDRRERGKAKMKEVYGWDVGDPGDTFTELTIDHLFGEVWARAPLSVRERRLLLIGLLVGSGLDDVVELQLDCALGLDELSAEEVREMAVFLAYYAGWPRGAKLHQITEKLLTRRDTDA